MEKGKGKGTIDEGNIHCPAVEAGVRKVIAEAKRNASCITHKTYHTQKYTKYKREIE